MKRILATSILVYAAIFFMAPIALSGQANEVTIEHNVEAKMRDGVILRADVYRPKSAGKFPVILERTPYDKRELVQPGMYGVDLGLVLAARGYVYILQDCRGRFASDGEWYALKHESEDGYDTVEWAAALPYSTGKVGMVGGSYLGATQMLTAMAAPPHLVAILPMFTASNYHDGWTYQGGAFEQWFIQSWTTTGLAPNTLLRRSGGDSDPNRLISTRPLTAYPLLDLGTIAGAADYYFDWLAHPRYDEFWKSLSIDEHDSQIVVPALHVGAWYDLFLGGTLENYTQIKKRGGSEAARRGQRLLIATGGHAGFDRKIGEVDFGEQSLIDLTEIELRWYDYILKGIQNGVESEKPVKIFVTGKNVWREEDDWPLPQAKTVHYYLHSSGKANTLNGDGSISTTAPGEEPADRYVDDPAEPVPTEGGALCCNPTNIMHPGPYDQRAVESRQDVLVFTTPAFAKDFEAIGPVSAELYVSSSAVDTDFTAKLVDVWPNGFAQNLTDGILRARYRDSQEQPTFMNPNEVYRVHVDLWGIANVFLAGHRLRLEISSSNFPRFDRNPNTGEEPASASRFTKATNVIYHDAKHPSVLMMSATP